MTRAISQNSIFDAIKKGVKTAFKDYKGMSGDNYGIPESYFQAKIADNIAKLDGNFYVTLEDMYVDILKNAGAHGKAISFLDNPTQRADIIVWWGTKKGGSEVSSGPRFIVEVKRLFQVEPLIKDRDKIQNVLRFQDSLQAGILVGIHPWMKNEDTIENTSGRHSEELDADLYDYISFKNGEDDYENTIYSGAGIFLFKK